MVEVFTHLYPFITECITSPVPRLEIWGETCWLVFWPLACLREPPSLTSLEPGMLLMLSACLVVRFFFLFGCGSFLNSLLNLLQYYFCFMFWSFGYKACEIAHQRSTPHPLCWKRKSQPLDHQGRPTPAADAAKSLQLCPTLCDTTDGSPPGSPVPGILQARTLEWVAISFSNA